MKISAVILSSLLSILSVAAAPATDANRDDVVRAATEELAKGGFDVTSSEAKLALSVKVEKAKRGYVARAQVIERSNKEVVVSARRKYLRAAEAEGIGHALGRVLATGLKAEDLDVEPVVDAVVEDISPSPAPTKKAVRPKEAKTETHKPSLEIKDEAPVTGPAANAVQKYSSAEDRSLLVTVGFGSQISSAYAVIVGGETTRLGYVLGPEPLLRAQVRSTPFTMPLALEAELDWAAVRYAIALEGNDAPVEPVGHFIDLRGGVAYDIDLAHWAGGTFQLSPKAGLGYRALAVQVPEQDALVIGSHWFAPQAGLGFALRFEDKATLEAHGLARAIMGYAEKPATTGDDGSGLGLTVGAGFRYWVADSLAISGGVDYDYAQIGLSGVGTRATFRGDPTLQDATVVQSELRAIAGLSYSR